MLILLNKTFSIKIRVRVRNENSEHLTEGEGNFQHNCSIQGHIDEFECDSIRDDHRIVIESSADYFVILIRSDCFGCPNAGPDRSRSGESVGEM